MIPQEFFLHVFVLTLAISKEFLHSGRTLPGFRGVWLEYALLALV